MQSPDWLFFRGQLSRFMSAAARMFRRPRPDNPEDPYAGVRCPKGPKLPHRNAAVALEEPREF